jgi:hypothetical protein
MICRENVPRREMMTLIQKLQAKGLETALVVNAPKEAAGIVKEIGAAMEVSDSPGKGPYGLILAFVQDSVQFAATLQKVRVIMIDSGKLWFAYPKKTSKRYASDMTRDSGWETMKTLGYSPVRQIALDDNWSALLFIHNSAKD